MPRPRRAYFDAPFVALAHRGGALLPANVGRENTLAAFRAAVDLGYRYLETDVHATRDGGLVAFHDDTLDRVTDGHGLLRDLRLADVRAARVGGEPVPTLDEVLGEFPDCRLNIDLKAPGAVVPLVAALDRHGAWDRVCVGSFGDRRLAAFRRLARGRAATSVGPAGVALAMGAARVGRGPAPAGDAFQVPVTTRVGGRRVPVVTAAFVRLAHRWGRQVHVWTIDEPDEMERLIDLGVDGLVSDRPDLLRTVLEQRGLWA